MLGRLMPTFDDLQNKVLAGLGIIIFTWGGWVTNRVLDMPTKAETEKFVDRELLIRDKHIQEIYTLIGKINVDMDRLEHNISLNNERIISSNEKFWASISLINIEIERAKLWRDQYKEDLDELKKKRVGEIPKPSWIPSSNPRELGWDRF
jgi:hypothetical protein